MGVIKYHKISKRETSLSL